MTFCKEHGGHLEIGQTCAYCGISNAGEAEDAAFREASAKVEQKIHDEMWDGMVPEVCDICSFNVELLGHSAECPKRVAG